MRFFDGRTQMEVAEGWDLAGAGFTVGENGLKNIRRYIGEERAKE